MNNKTTNRNVNRTDKSKFKKVQGIEELYRNVHYFDQYGGSVLTVVLLLMVAFVFVSYCYAAIQSQAIAEDWANQRCKLNVLPIAGFITHPEGMSAVDFTYQNFTFCTQSILQKMMGYMLAPLTYVTQQMTSTSQNVSEEINSVRAMFDKIRTFFQTIVVEIMNRLLNTMVPLQQILLGVRDMIQKMQGTLTASLYTSFGAYFALKSLLGAIAQFLVAILIALAAMIAILFASPFTMGMAGAYVAVFVSIAVPVAIILAFMKDVLKVNPHLSIPKIKCFDENVCIDVYSLKPIKEARLGDILDTNHKITAIVQVESRGSHMYELYGIVVSDSHQVFWEEKQCFVPVRQHPDAILHSTYEKPILYCLNTTSKTIPLKTKNNETIIFTDWDEIYDDTNKNTLQHILQHMHTKTTENIHVQIDGGFVPNTLIALANGETKQISRICVGERLIGGEYVYGIVQIDGTTVRNQFDYFWKTPHVQTYSLAFQGTNIWLKEQVETFAKKQSIKREPVLYHLLTDTGHFSVNLLKNNVYVHVYDYNYGIDSFFN